MSRGQRAGRVGVGLLCASALAPGVASAGTLTMTGDTLTYTAAAGEANSVGVFASQTMFNGIAFFDSAGVSHPGGECAAAPVPNSYECPGVLAIVVTLGDQDDLLTTSGAVAQKLTAHGSTGADIMRGSGQNSVLMGGDGEDRLSLAGGNAMLDGGPDTGLVTGGPGVDILDGSGGDDILDGGGGVGDTVRGGAGDDRLHDGDGDVPDTDSLDGGEGSDWLDSYADRIAPINVVLGAGSSAGQAGENDSVAGIENVQGGLGADTLTGDAAANSLIGNAGADAIDGGAGSDGLAGGDGNDTLIGGACHDSVAGDGGDDAVNVADGAGDFVTCGAGAGDAATGEAADAVVPDCESVAGGVTVIGAPIVGPPGLKGDRGPAGPGVQGVQPTADPRPQPTVSFTGADKPELTLVRDRGGRKFVVLKLAGELRVPAGVSKSLACRGKLILTVSSTRRNIASRSAPLSRSCAYAQTFKIARARFKERRVAINVTFAGNAYLKGVRTQGTEQLKKQW